MRLKAWNMRAAIMAALLLVLPATFGGTGIPIITPSSLPGTGQYLTWHNGLWVPTSASQQSVTSISFSIAGPFSVSGSPMSAPGGSIVVSLASQPQNQIWASPDGTSGIPSFRALVSGDLPSDAARTDVDNNFSAHQTINYTSATSPDYSLKINSTISSAPTTFDDIRINRGGFQGFGNFLSCYFGGNLKASIDPTGVITGTQFSMTQQVGQNAAWMGGLSAPHLPVFRNITPADLPVFIGSGASHAAGIVPDPGPTSGTIHYLREDASWFQPSISDLAVPTGNVSWNNFGITNLAAPSNPADAVNKSYVDGIAGGLQIKPTATVATTGALPANTYSNGTAGVGATLTATGNGVLTIDGHATVLNDLILVKNEAASADNGLYTVTTAGTVSVPYVLTRSTSMDSSSKYAGAFVAVGSVGVANANSLWLCNPSTPVTVGTTLIPFTQLNAATSLTAGTGISIIGNTINNTGVTSVGLAAPSILSVSNSPVTTTGNLTLSLANQSAGTVFAGPGTGGATTPTFRAIVPTDLPVFVGSGVGHAPGSVPDPGSTSGTTHFLREDATWAVPNFVTSVGLSMPTGFTVSGSPITSSGTLSVGFSSETANTFLAGPNGSSGTPSFRAIVPADMPVFVGSGSSHTTGAVPDPGASAGTAKFLREDSSWSLPPVISVNGMTGAVNVGTVTSIDLGVPNIFSVSNNPITTTGTIDISLVNQSPHTVFAGPTGSGAATPTFRGLVAADIPSILESQVTNLVTDLGSKIPNSASLTTASPLTGGGALASNLTLSVNTMGASGPSHGSGVVPDPGSTTGTSKYLREDGTWNIPPGVNGSGTVTSVDMFTDSSLFTISGVPITTSGRIGLISVQQPPNKVFAAGSVPGSGNAIPTFRTLVLADLPSGIAYLNQQNAFTPTITGAQASNITASNSGVYIDATFQTIPSGSFSAFTVDGLDSSVTTLGNRYVADFKYNGQDLVTIDQLGNLATITDVTATNVHTKHIIGAGATPSISGGTSGGTSPTLAISGSDVAGQVQVTIGSGPAGNNPIVTVIFNQSYTTSPYVTLTPANAAAAALSGNTAVYVNTFTNSFIINAGTSALTPGSKYVWNYLVSQ